jgi:AraC-like DNA-binding protein
LAVRRYNGYEKRKFLILPRRQDKNLAERGRITMKGPSDFLTSFGSKAPDALADLFDCVLCEAFTYNVLAFTAPWRQSHGGLADAIGYYVLAGSARLQVASEQPVDLHQGDNVIVVPNLPHSLCNIAPDGESLIGRTTYGLDVARAQPLLRVLPPFFVLRGEYDNVQDHVALAHMSVQLRDDTENGNSALIRRLTEALFIFSILAYRRKQMALSLEAPADPATSRIGPTLHAMHRHPDRDWTLPMLARESGLSRSLFCNEFVKSMGDTPARYLTRLRMSQARDLLRHSDLSLATIAYRVGYRDVVTLGRAFRRHFGSTLGEFRMGGQKPADML